MKARMTYWNGFWWCRRMGCTGQGATMQEAWDDMWKLYFEAVRPPRPQTFHSSRVRCG